LEREGAYWSIRREQTYNLIRRWVGVSVTSFAREKGNQYKSNIRNIVNISSTSYY